MSLNDGNYNYNNHNVIITHQDVKLMPKQRYYGRIPKKMNMKLYFPF